MRLNGMVAVITGASRGLGRALALAFAREGASLALCSRGQEALEQVAAEVAGRWPRLIGVSCELIVQTSTGVHQGSLLKSQLLCQLSYAGAPVIVFAESSSACRRRYGRPPALLSKLLSNPKTVVKPHGVEKVKLLEFRTSSPTPCDAQARLDRDRPVDDVSGLRRVDEVSTGDTIFFPPLPTGSATLAASAEPTTHR
jgi:hypothetical protein